MGRENQVKALRVPLGVEGWVTTHTGKLSCDMACHSVMEVTGRLERPLHLGDLGKAVG